MDLAAGIPYSERLFGALALPGAHALRRRWYRLGWCPLAPSFTWGGREVGYANPCLDSFVNHSSGDLHRYAVSYGDRDPYEDVESHGVAYQHKHAYRDAHDPPDVNPHRNADAGTAADA
ncbi:MAG: hypothetical protein ACP5G7_11605 [Anaerolineae bacterium]